MGDRRRRGRRDVDVASELNHPDRTANPDVGHAGQIEAGASPADRPAEIRSTAATQSPESSSTDNDASATEQASGLAMNVGPCASTGTEPDEIPAATSAVHKAAASDMYPPVSALPTHITSGATPACPAANSDPPVRPNPVAISSKINSTPASSQADRSTRR